MDFMTLFQNFFYFFLAFLDFCCFFGGGFRLFAFYFFRPVEGFFFCFFSFYFIFCF